MNGTPMSWKVLVALALLPGAFRPAAGDAKEEIEDALGKLSGADSLSWVSTIIEEKEGKAPQVAETLEGKATRNGWCRIYRPKTKKSTEAYLKGDRIALLTPEGWKPIDVKEVPGGGKPDKTARLAQEFVRARSPAAQAKVLLGRTPDLRKQENGLYAGRLADKDVSVILDSMAEAGVKVPTFENPRLRVNFRVRDGVLASFELVVTGREIKKKGTVEEFLFSVAVDFSDVGATTLDVPEEARKLLE